MKKKILLLTCLAALLAAVFAVGCSQQKGDSSSQGGWRKSDSQSGQRENNSSQTRIYGKVKSVIGNQVVLAIGTRNESGKSGSGSAQGQGEDQTSSTGETSSTKPSASGSNITLTGETQTLLIPVGLSLSSAGMGGPNVPGTGGGTSNASGNWQARSGGSGINRSTASGAMGAAGNAGAAGSTGRSSTGAGLTASKRTSDFSSIKAGMVLAITEQTQSDGTKQITRVSVLSK